MKDVTGKGAKLNDAPVLNNLPLHDLTGGNTFVPQLIKQLYSAEVNTAALDAGVERARNMLRNAANLELNVDGNIAYVKVTNLTGHNCPPAIRKAGVYGSICDFMAAVANYLRNLVLTMLLPASCNTLKPWDNGTIFKTKIYECKPGMSQEVVDALNPARPADRKLTAGPTFHMSLNNMIYFDNRIPPPGFTNARLNEYQSPVVCEGVYYPDGQNWDVTAYPLPAGTVKVEARLYYQTATKEYIEFLRNENYTKTKGKELYDMWLAHGKSTPELMNSATWPAQHNILTAALQQVTRITNRNGIAYAQAAVLVTANNLPVSGATVTASYTRPTCGTVSGVTGTDGKVLLNSSSIKTTTGQWGFTITNATKTGYTNSGGPQQLCEPLTPAARNPVAMSPSLHTPAVKVFPNPFTDRLYFNVTTHQLSQVVIALFDVSGKQVAMVYDKVMPAGQYLPVAFNAKALKPGIYLYKVRMGDKEYQGKVICQK